MRTHFDRTVPCVAWKCRWRSSALTLLCALPPAGAHPEHAEPGAAEAVGQRCAAPAQQCAGGHPAPRGRLLHLAAGPVRATRRVLLGACPTRSKSPSLRGDSGSPAPGCRAARQPLAPAVRADGGSLPRATCQAEPACASTPGPAEFVCTVCRRHRTGRERARLTQTGSSSVRWLHATHGPPALQGAAHSCCRCRACRTSAGWTSRSRRFGRRWSCR